MIYNNNCFEIFQKLDKKSIDLVLVNLPKQFNFDKMWIELKRICKKKCLFVFFTTTKYGIDLLNSNPKWFKYDLIWYKNKKHKMIYIFGNYNQRKSDNSIATYNKQLTKGKPYKSRESDLTNSYYRDGKEYKSIGNDNKGTRNPDSILKFNTNAIYEWLIKTYSNEGDTVLDFMASSMITKRCCINTNRKFILIFN